MKSCSPSDSRAKKMVKACWPKPGHQLGRFAHGGQVGADIDGVGDEQQRHQARHQPARHHLAHVAGQAMAGDAPDQGADHLDRHHQRKGQQHGPEQVEAELRARLAVGGDAAGIVVGRAGDQARSQLVEQRDAVDRRARRPVLGFAACHGGSGGRMSVQKARFQERAVRQSVLSAGGPGWRLA